MKVNWLPAVVPGRVTMTTQQPFFFEEFHQFQRSEKQERISYNIPKSN